MVKKRRRWRVFRKKAAFAASAGQAIFALLESMGGSGARPRMAALWENWSQVLGEDLAGLAKPLAHKEGTLFLGARDSLEIQELSLSSCEILERVNNFLGFPHFSKIRVQLLEDGRAGVKTSKNVPPAGAKQAMPGADRVRPRGNFLAEMDMNSPVAKCYALFAGLENSVSPESDRRGRKRNFPKK